MVDRLMTYRGLQGDGLPSEKYEPSFAITSVNYLNTDAGNLKVIIPPWHGNKSVQILGRRLARQGNAVLAYTFHDDVLSPDVSEVPLSFEAIQQQVAFDLNGLHEARSYKNIELIALSLGNSALALIVESFINFDCATFVTPASSLASSMWHGTRTRRIRSELESQGYTLPDIETAWANLAPSNHVQALTDKNVRVLLSTNDEVIPTSYQEAFVTSLHTAGIEPTVHRTRLGHYATIGRFCLTN